MNDDDADRFETHLYIHFLSDLIGSILVILLCRFLSRFYFILDCFVGFSYYNVIKVRPFAMPQYGLVLSIECSVDLPHFFFCYL